MADLYGANARSSSLESEELSSFLHNLLHNSSLPSPTSCGSSKAKQLPSFSSTSPQPPPPVPETTRLFRRSGAVISDSDCAATDGASSIAGSLLIVGPNSGSNFSDPGSFFPAGGEESKIGVVDTDAISSLAKARKFPERNDVNELSFNGEFRSKTGDQRGHENTDVHQVPLRSKRTRAAEVHNLSEKRRRSRINEKLKALQNLIPNSNKTDKASMLDEAIEYLKQLQLQVQMLSLRNGLSLHPTYVAHPMQLPEMELVSDERNGLLNTNTRGDAYPGNGEISTRPPFDLSNQCTSSYQSVLISPIVNVNPATSFGLESHSESL